MFMPDEKQLKRKLEEQKIEALKARLEASSGFKIDSKTAKKEPVVSRTEKKPELPVDPNLSRKDNLNNFLQAELASQQKKQMKKLLQKKQLIH